MQTGLAMQVVSPVTKGGFTARSLHGHQRFSVFSLLPFRSYTPPNVQFWPI